VTLADRIEAVLLERGPLPRFAIARELGKRDSEVLDALLSDRRFARSGKTKASRWAVQKAGFDAVELAALLDIEPAMAEEFLFGPEGFLEHGFVVSLNGNGRVLVTERGMTLSRALESVA
jgi:hypothetical protein